MEKINSEYLNKTKKIWNEYILTGKDLDPAALGIRPIIAESWKRSKNFNVSPTSMQDTQLDQEALANIQKENRDLITIAMPYLENLYEYMRGTNYLIQLCDSNSRVLKCLSNNDRIEDMMTVLSSRQEGYLVSEEIIGTNSTGLCQHLQKPVQVFAEEHFQSRNHNFACSSAPIFDDEHNIIGILTLMCLKDSMQQHTLGMVSAAADGIKKELSIKKAYNELILTNNILSSAMEAIKSGIILIDEFKNITLHNQNVLKVLKLPPKSIRGFNIYEIIKKDSFPLDLRDLDVSANETELTAVNHLGQSSDVVLILKTILDSNKDVKATLLSFMPQKHLHRLSNKTAGLHATYTFDSILRTSKSMQSVIDMGTMAAASDSPVLLLGESGTGKELIAQSIHNASFRSNEPFVSINCGAIPKNLIASELFGAEYGAFTGASRSGNPGKFELANGGTLFLDEIGDMPFDLQVMLLRVLQSKEITRLGGKFPKKVDVRIISATNKNLINSINNNTFRADLYYRLNVLNISIPPLRDRPEDIPVLAENFIYRYASLINKSVRSISDSAMDKLLNYTWPGNVRELENAIERAVNIASTDTITINDLPGEIVINHSDHMQQPQIQQFANTTETVHNYRSSNSNVPFDQYGTSPEVQEYKTLVHLLKQEHGHVKTVAKRANIPLSTLYAKLKKYNLNPSDFKKW